MRPEQVAQELLAYYNQLLHKAYAALHEAQDEEAKQQIHHDIFSINLATIVLRCVLSESAMAVPNELQKKYAADLKVLTLPPRKH